MEQLTTLILCGGKGTRAYPHTVELPKPLLQVDGMPILRHVMDIYARAGFVSFVLAGGFRCDMIESFAATVPQDWSVTVVDTGLETGTGERIRRCSDLLGDRFFATYADGVGDVDLRALLAFHHTHAGAATLTTVPLPSQYGTIEQADGGRVMAFREKPVLRDHWINGGFFCMDARVFDLWRGTDLEREVLPGLGAAGELYAYRHAGFWKSMDTYKDAQELTELCTGREVAPWVRSPARASS